MKAIAAAAGPPERAEGHEREPRGDAAAAASQAVAGSQDASGEPEQHKSRGHTAERHEQPGPGVGVCASEHQADHQRADRGDGEDVEDAWPADQHRCGDQGRCEDPRRDGGQQRISGQQAVREQRADWFTGMGGEYRPQDNGDGVADHDSEATRPPSLADHEHDRVHRPGTRSPETLELGLLLLPHADG